jgi:hypothetical protein
MSEDCHSSFNETIASRCIICGGAAYTNPPGGVCTLCLLPAHHTTEAYVKALMRLSPCPHLVVDKFGRCESCFKSLAAAESINEPTAKEIAWLAAGRVKW